MYGPWSTGFGDFFGFNVGNSKREVKSEVEKAKLEMPKVEI